MTIKSSIQSKSLLESISLSGLTIAPPQVFGGVRLAPLLRSDVRSDLRLARRSYDEDIAEVRLDKNTAYYSYVPHGLVATWSGDETPVAPFGTQVNKHKQPRTTDGMSYDFGFATARVLRKVRAREDKNRLRFLPLDVAMEGFLALHFGGPSVAWEEYSRHALSRGLGPRSETVHHGRSIVGLEDALRMFEIHEGQVGVLVFVADALASAFVLPHPDDYLVLHRTLLTDFYGPLIYTYGFVAQESSYHPDSISPDAVDSLDDLRGEVARLRSDWSQLHEWMVTKLFDRPIDSQLVYKMGPFQMQRFMTDLNPKQENHIGEVIVGDDGHLQYLKTYRLSAAQCRRAFLLKQLAQSDWNLEACALKLDSTKNQLIYRIENAGFGYMLHQHVLDAAKAARRKR